MCTSIIDFVSLPVRMTSLGYHLLNFHCAPSTVLCIARMLPLTFHSCLVNGYYNPHFKDKEAKGSG